MPTVFSKSSRPQQRLALLLVMLMLTLPWSAMSSSNLEGRDDDSRATPKAWGASGSNDTGWISLDAIGADPANGTMAYADLFMDFAPGALLDNLTFEIACDGSDGYWANEPQITLMDTQSPILDWRDYGDLCRQDSFSENPPEVDGGVLDTWLQPNSVSDASWLLPSGVTISDLVIDALRPADPRVSFSTQDTTIHDSVTNPIDGRLYILLDDDLLHLDDQASKQIIDIELGVQGRSLAIDADGNRLLIGTADGKVLSRSLVDSSVQDNLMEMDDQTTVVRAVSVDDYGTRWAVSDCSLHHKTVSQTSWTENDFCTTDLLEVPTDLLIFSDKIYVATAESGMRILDYNTTSDSTGISVSIDTNTQWTTGNYLTSNSITQLEKLNSNLLIATIGGGVNRYDMVADTWLATWSTNNWLSSNVVRGLALTEDWLHILAGSTVHAYDTGALLFRSQRQVTDMGLLNTGRTIIAWPSLGFRSPTSGLMMVSDGSGTLARQTGETLDGTMVLVSGPASSQMEVVAHIDDGEQGEIWIGGSNIIDRFDEADQVWRAPIDLTDYVNNPSSVTSIVQDDQGIVWIGTLEAGLLRLEADNGNFQGTASGISSEHVSSLSFDANSNTLVVGHYESGISLINTSTNTLIEVMTTQDGLDSDMVIEVATRYGIAYIATPDAGVMRVNLYDVSILGSWQSLGADNLEATPVAVVDDTMYLGLTGFGILVIDRLTGDISDHWTQSGNLPDDDVLSLHIDYNGGLLVGSSVSNTGASGNGGLARWDGGNWQVLPTSIPGWGNDPYVFYDVTSDANGIYAGTNRGACIWNWTYDLQECISNQDGMPSRFVAAVAKIGTDRLYAGTSNGAAVINTLNGSVIDVWTAGDSTQRARTVKIGDILYLGFENTGIARYDLVNQTWLQAWDGTQGYINDDDVTALVHGRNEGTMWAGGDFGLVLIDVVNDTVLKSWNRGANNDGPTLSNTPPADIVIIGDVLHYSLQRSNSWWASNDDIIRIYLDNNTSLSTLDAGSKIGTDGVIHGIGAVGDELWIGVRPRSWNQGDGTIIRWNATSQEWSANLDTIGNVLRVNARFLGDCFPLTQSCEMWVAYGNNIMRRFKADTMTLLDEWTDIDGPIRGMEEWNGTYLFASMNGILRWDPHNETWLDSWVEDDGLPSGSAEEFYSMEVVGNGLWLGSYGGGNSGSEIMLLDGSTDNWTTWNLGTGDIPGGYPADIEVCNDVIHFMIGRVSWWGNQGGIARFDMADWDGDGITNEWIAPMTEGNQGLSDNDPRAAACDEQNDVLYIGFDTDGIGFDRYNYNTNLFMRTLGSADGISEDRIFPGGMLHHNNVLLAAHQYDNTGGISRIITSGTSTANGQVLDPGMDGCSIERAPSSTTPVYAIGRSGQTTGLNRVDRLDSTGLIVSGYDELAGLTSGRVVEFESNETHVWVALTSDSNGYYASSVLQGELLANGSVRWEFGYNANQDVINSLKLDGEELWVSTAGRGLWSIDLTNRIFAPTPAALHSQMDEMVLEDDGTMYVGLMGNQGSAAGYQTFNTNTRSWGHGSLIAGLPSNTVRDFLEYGDHIMVATYGGIGLWNTTRDDWDDPITTIDGLPTPIIEHLFAIESSNQTTSIQGNGTVLAGGAAGLTVLDRDNLSVLDTLDFGDGLIGNMVSGIVFAEATSRLVVNPDGSSTVLHHDAALFISHNGQGSTRPGVAAWDIATDMANGTYQIDMIPSNDVRAIVTDDWGVHIATDSEPLVHWNATMMEMESGLGRNTLLTWPPFQMVSDGDYIAVVSPRGIDVVRSGGDHSRVTSEIVPGISAAFLDNSGLYVVAEDGLHIFEPVESLRELERGHQRRADPLIALYAGNSWDITDTTHPGMSTVLITDENPIIIPQSNEMWIPGKLPLYTGALTLSAPQSGAWVQAESRFLNYSGMWDLAAMNPLIESSFQAAVSNLAPGSSSAQLHIQMQSPQNGSLQVRITYDWQRVEVPTEMTSFLDRPNDGGGVLEASWLPAEDAAWNAYRLYVWDSTDDPDWEITQDKLSDFSTYIEIPFWSQTTATITTADWEGTEVPLADDREYRAAIAIAYADGSVGQPMSWPLSATPTDEVPFPPDWLGAEPISGGSAGTIYVEWSACTELDPDRTRLWAVQHPISNAIALNDEIDVAYGAGNSTVLQLEPGKTYWLAAACVDEAGQLDAANATVFGPIVTAGGLDDGIPPSPITDTSAVDAPDDEGGRITVTWTPNDEEDCIYHTVYVLPASGFQPPSTVDGWPVAAYVTDCTTGEIVIDSMGESSLENGVAYWIGVVAADDWGNENLDDVLVVDATPMANIQGQGQPPPRVEGLSAWDHPDDDGTAIDIVWNRSLAADFSHYVIWVSDYPLNDLTEIWAKHPNPADLDYHCSDDPASCGLIEIDQRQIGGALQLQITVTTALYGSTVETLSSQPIVPSIPLYVTITTHDIVGNVYLTGMEEHMVLVSPLDNRGDISPPNRLGKPILEDRSPDDGDAMFVTFPESEASDIGEYWIYAAAGAPFDSIGNMEPAIVVSREAQMPILLETVSAGQSLAPSVPIWVVVVPVDSSGNYWDSNLQAEMISLVDENSLDPGLHLAEITGIRANWNPSGDHVEIRWDDSNDPQIESYLVFVSLEPFEITSEASRVGLIEDPTTMMILSDIEGEAVDNAATHWLAIVGFDGEVHRLAVDPLEVRPWSEASFGSSEGGEGEAGESWYDQLMSGDMNTLIAMVSAVMILIGALMVIRPRQQAAPEPWEMGALEVELEEQMAREAAGLTDDDFEDDLMVDDDGPSFSSAQDAELEDEADTDAPDASEAVIDELLGVGPDDTDIDDLDDMADDLDFDDLGDMAEGLNEEDEDVDPSFLDDML
ncbi:MAG: two-component regulator propeller domain-containing protein [Candidatus Thalassarchaeum sp.]